MKHRKPSRDAGFSLLHEVSMVCSCDEPKSQVSEIVFNSLPHELRFSKVSKNQKNHTAIQITEEILDKLIHFLSSFGLQKLDYDSKNKVLIVKMPDGIYFLPIDFWFVSDGQGKWVGYEKHLFEKLFT